ncbi:hypothetical protein KC19_12G142600 [Ceratodon purpureus]|uniref:DNA-directed RNA polymerase III subunit RPC3 n=1 Tax=Ceratodon purpureus TaxID=3225 RepID=A0A8T0G705_CERPU|nr:hypothetical protein KC19_12G142600 [Ceratodon purpureus]
MATAFGRKLCCDLIQTHFGDLVQKVVKELAYRGPLALQDIARFSGLNAAALKSSILVLVQHSCVQAFKVEHEGVGTAPARTSTSYVAISDNILHRMRFPKFLMVVREELGEEAESLVEGLLEHGRLTLEQIIQRTAAKAGKAEGQLAKEVKETFRSLVEAHFIERCPAAEPSLQPKDAQEPPKKVPRGAAKVRGPILDAQDAGAEVIQRILRAASASETERFQLPITMVTLSDPALANDLVDSAPTGQKRKHETLKMDSKTAAAVDEKEVLWRVNYEEFLRKLRHQTCVEMVKTRIDTGAAAILSAMLQVTRKQETSARQHYSVPLSMDAIVQAVRSSPEGQHMPLERIRGVVSQLAADGIGYLSRSGERAGPSDGGNSYAINMRNIIEARQKNEVEGIILQRFGRECCRIYRLLSIKGQLEQKQIGERAMAPKNVKELLYRLLKEQYVQVQEIAKTSEHIAIKSIFLWKVNHRAVLYRVLDDLYHAATNLCLRHGHEIQKEQEVLGLVDQLDATREAGPDAHVPHVTLTSTQQEQVRRISRITSILDASLLKLDDAILLFHDF